MPETLTDIKAQDEQRRKRAFAYERAVADRARATANIDGYQKEADAYAKQITLITKLVRDAEQVDASIDVTWSSIINTVQGCCRDVIVTAL